MACSMLFLFVYSYVVHRCVQNCTFECMFLCVSMQPFFFSSNRISFVGEVPFLQKQAMDAVHGIFYLHAVVYLYSYRCVYICVYVCVFQYATSFSSNSSSFVGEVRSPQKPTVDMLHMVSLQSSARPGCLLELEPINDAMAVSWCSVDVMAVCKMMCLAVLSCIHVPCFVSVSWPSSK